MTKSNKVMTRAALVLIVAGTFSLLAVLICSRMGTDARAAPDAVSSTLAGGRCSLIVTANSDGIGDKEAFAGEVIRMCRDNSFRSLRLSTDIDGWPEELCITVYLHRADIGKGDPVMKIIYEPLEACGDCNIRDDPEKYRVRIEEV